MLNNIHSSIDQREFEKEGLKHSLNIVYLLSAVVHIGFLVLFIKTGVTILQVFNYFSPILFIACYLFNRSGNETTAALIGLSEATVHGFLCTYLLGWNSGFYYFILLGYLLIFFYFELKPYIKIILSFALTLSVVWLYVKSNSEVPVYLMHAKVYFYLHAVNLIITVVVISVFSVIYTSYLRRMEIRLKENISKMADTQNILVDQVEETNQIQAELVKENALLNALMENLPDHVYFKDLDSRFIRISREMANIFNVKDINSMIGKSDSDFHFKEAAEIFKKEEEEIIRSKKGFVNKLVFQKYPNGIEQWVTTTKLPLFDISGNCIGTFGLTRDESYLKKLEIEAQEQAQMLEEREEVILKKEEEQRLLNQQKIKFFSIFSHDLMNPLNAMQGFTQLLWDKYDKYDDEKRRRMLSDTVKLMVVFKSMVANLLDWSRSQLNTISARPVNVNLFLLITDVTNLYKIQQSQKQIRLEINADENLVIVTDEYILQTVVRNIYSNALKYTHPGGIIKISAALTNKFVLIDIADNGVGMTQNEIKNLFSLREETSKVGTLNEKGTGLGLIVCQEYLSHINGHITVESTIDKGSVFSIRFEN